MIPLTFLEFFKGDYFDAGNELYFLRDLDEQALYIGISTDSIWHRWFGSGNGHMIIDFDGEIHGASHIGHVIENNFPLSWEWNLDLLTEEDCAKILAEESDDKDLTKLDIVFLEIEMINRFSPLYNVLHGGGYHEDPKASKKLDDDYKKIFG
jgi:hypothetical protein